MLGHDPISSTPISGEVGLQVVVAVGIARAGAFGAGADRLVEYDLGIVSGQAFGAGIDRLVETGAGITTAEAFGAPGSIAVGGAGGGSAVIIVGRLGGDGREELRRRLRRLPRSCCRRYPSIRKRRW